MGLFYNFLTYVATAHIWLAHFFSKKLKLFVTGRKRSFQILSEKIHTTDKSIWFHCASLGEFEQGFPIMEAVKKKFPKHKIVISFFSSSGYEIKKQTPIADAVVYLPMDTRKNVRKFIAVAKPALALFVKYEFWPNYLLELQAQSIPTLLIAGLFRKEQVFFKPYGGFMRKALSTFTHLFVQDNDSKILLESLDLNNITISGDTRFDRVSHQIEQDNALSFMDEFKGNSVCVVCGSTWPEDEAVLMEYLNTAPSNVTFVIAPHKIDSRKINSFRSKLNKPSKLYSEINSKNNLAPSKQLTDYSVLIIDTIGLLTKIYSYADIAYVGGAMGKTGLHNILEPATFGVPIIIGKNYNQFPEASRLRSLAGLFSVANESDCTALLTKLVTDSQFRSKTGMIAGHFVNSNTGATQKTMAFIDKLNADGLI